MPEPGRDETVRVVALDKNFHMKCYKCEVSCPFCLERSLSHGKTKGLANGREELWVCLVHVCTGIGGVVAVRSSQNAVGIGWDRLQPCGGMAVGRFPADCTPTEEAW